MVKFEAMTLQRVSHNILSLSLSLTVPFQGEHIARIRIFFEHKERVL